MRKLSPCLVALALVLLVDVVVGALGGATVHAAGPAPEGPGPLVKLDDADLAPYRADPAVETPYKTGERFLAALEARDPRVSAGVLDAATVRFHDQEARRFAKDKRAVLTAYGVLYAILVAFVVALGLRQRKLLARIDALSAKLAVTEPRG